MMSGKMKKILLLLLAAGLLFASGRVQNSLNGDREKLGITRIAPLENAPPVLAFTTVALGGFRGLISNMLWIRATQLQEDGKYFEMMQLADWITKLEPHFAQVWANQAWNMAYNISVKFKDFSDRWRWVRAGIELLRDEGLKYNPNDSMLFRELSWIFQHKMGASMDDANVYYKIQWAGEMSAIFGESGKPNFDELAAPKSPDATNRARLLTEKYKMNPLLMKEADERFGPLEWRLPEASAVYWAFAGLKMVETIDTNRLDKFYVMSLRRSIYQSMLYSFHQGRLIRDPFSNRKIEFGPNLALIPKVNAAYEDMMHESPEDAEVIGRAHRNFLGDAVYFLYSHNRNREASTWYDYLAKHYGDRPLLLVNQSAYPTNLTYDVYASSRIQEDVGETSRARVKAHIEGFLTSAYKYMALDDLDRYYGLKNNQARRLHKRFMDAIGPESTERIGLPPFEDIDRDVLSRVLDPEEGFPYEARARIRAQLGMPSETRPAPSTNAPAGPSTNGVPSGATPPA
jgi:hypothetical protein